VRDPALELASFKRQFKTFLFARYSTQRIERIRDVMTMRYINQYTGWPKKVSHYRESSLNHIKNRQPG